MFSGLRKHCRDRYATPHGVVGNPASPTATDREPITGFGGRVWERSRATDMEALTGLGGMLERTNRRLHAPNYRCTAKYK